MILILLVCYFCSCCKLKGKDEVIANLERELQKCKKDLNETLIEFGRMLVENDRKVTEERAESIFEETFKSGVANISSTLSEISQLPKAAQLPQVDEASTLAAAMQTLEVKSPNNVEIQPPVLVEPSVQESEEESSSSYKVSLAYESSTAVERHIYNNYKLLLLTISDMLLPSEVQEFKEWARDVFSVNVSTYEYEGFLELDQKGIISASDLTNLREFFWKQQKFDIVCLIDCFLQGNYASLQRSVSSRKINNPSRNTRNAGIEATSSSATIDRAGLIVTNGVAPNKYGKTKREKR